MLYTLLKKNKNQFYIIITILFLANIFGYYYQVTSVEKLFSVNLSLKSKLSFYIDESEDISFNKVMLRGKTLEKYQRSLQLRMEEKVNYEIMYDENLSELDKICNNLKIKIKEKYYFINCTTSNPNSSVEFIMANLSKVLKKTLDDIELIVIKNDLKQLAVYQKELSNNFFNIINIKSTDKKNHFKNLIILNSILFFIYIVFIYNAKKIKKIFS